MKKLVIITPQSVYSGWVKNGMAELGDSLANSLGKDYTVTMICVDGGGTFARTASDMREIEPGVRACRFSTVDYYLVKEKLWASKVAELVELIAPDILHNFAEPDLLSKLATRPARAVYTFDTADQVENPEYLRDYDAVTTVSETYARQVLADGGNLATVLADLNFRGITNGILTPVISPEKGLLIASKYTAEDQSGKAVCKKRLLQMYGIQGDPALFLYMGRLVAEKGMEQMLACVDTIRENDCVLIVVGQGAEEYEYTLRKYKRSDGVVYVDRWVSPVQAAPLAAGADFYLNPSLFEACGLMPMTASRYGAIPIVTPVGGLVDNFNSENAIIVTDTLDAAIEQAAELYRDTEALTAKRKACMEQDFSWATRKQGYIALYEGVE